MDSKQDQKAPDNDNGKNTARVHKTRDAVVYGIVAVGVGLLLLGLVSWVVTDGWSTSEVGIECTQPKTSEGAETAAQAVRMAVAALVSQTEGPDDAETVFQVNGPYYVDGQLILTGTEGDITELVADLEQGRLGDKGGITLKEKETCTLRAGGILRPKEEMSLRSVGGGGTVEDVLEAVDGSRYEGSVSVDPNYLTGILGTSVCGNPHGVRPSPWELVAYPHGVRPSPVDGEGAASGSSADAFRDQWAFEQIGLTPEDLTGFQAATYPASGTGVRVGVLDTSPFYEEVEEAVGAVLVDDISTVLLGPEHGVDPPWTLEVAFPELPALTLSPGQTLPADSEAEDDEEAADIDLSDHGLFVSGLIHALAPESKVQLIRVLNQYGCGNLFTLNKAIYDFAERADADRNALEGAVLNLSLGVQKPRPDEGDAAQQTEGDQPEQETDTETPTPTPTPTAPGDQAAAQNPNILMDDSVESLQQVVEHALAKGVVVVAAAGNDSYTGTVPLSPHLPAAHPQVIGVSGTNLGRQRSCFSNWGDVAAPAGDGVPGTDEESNEEKPCLSTLGNCDEEDCNPTAIISLVDNLTKGYAYWTGTSFAAPMTSGLSAMVMDKGASKCLWKARWVSPADVFAAVRCGAPTADGVINVPATLERCMP